VCWCFAVATPHTQVVILGQRLSAQKWLSLLFLTVGVVMVQLPAGASGAALKFTGPEGASALAGLGAVGAACITSGFAGVCV